MTAKPHQAVLLPCTHCIGFCNTIMPVLSRSSWCVCVSEKLHSYYHSNRIYWTSNTLLLECIWSCRALQKFQLHVLGFTYWISECALPFLLRIITRDRHIILFNFPIILFPNSSILPYYSFPLFLFLPYYSFPYHEPYVVD